MAWMKSGFFHEHGQLAEERWTTLVFLFLTAAGFLSTAIAYRRSRRRLRHPWFVLVISLLAISLAAVAVYNLATARIGAKDSIF